MDTYTRIKSQSPETPPPLPALDEIDLAAATGSGSAQRGDDLWQHALGDQARIALLGEAFIRSIVTERVFLSFAGSNGSTELFTAMQTKILNDHNIWEWFVFYAQHDPTLSPAMVGRERCSVEEAKNMFYAYVGAIFARFGEEGARHWSIKLVDPYINL